MLRYKTFDMMLPPSMTNAKHERSQATVNIFNRGMPEVEGEVCIDGKWIVGHVAMRPEYLASGYLPIPRLGEDAIGLTFPLAPGATIKRFESIPLWMWLLVKALTSFIPASMERANLVVLDALRKGSQVIEQACGLEAYDRAARSKSSL